MVIYYKLDERTNERISHTAHFMSSAAVATVKVSIGKPLCLKWCPTCVMQANAEKALSCISNLRKNCEKSIFFVFQTVIRAFEYVNFTVTHHNQPFSYCSWFLVPCKKSSHFKNSGHAFSFTLEHFPR